MNFIRIRAEQRAEQQRCQLRDLLEQREQQAVQGAVRFVYGYFGEQIEPVYFVLVAERRLVRGARTSLRHHDVQLHDELIVLVDVDVRERLLAFKGRLGHDRLLLVYILDQIEVERRLTDLNQAGLVYVR